MAFFARFDAELVADRAEKPRDEVLRAIDDTGCRRYTTLVNRPRCIAGYRGVRLRGLRGATRRASARRVRARGRRKRRSRAAARGAAPWSSATARPDARRRRPARRPPPE